MTVQFDRIVRTAANDDFFAAIVAKMADRQLLDRQRRQRPTVPGAKVRLHRLDRARPLDAKRGHGSATRRRKFNHVEHC